MSHASADAHIRFTLHPDYHPSVIATTSGPTSDAARSHLHDLGFRSTGPDTMALARIDHEEPYYANAAATQLIRYGFTVEIAPPLQEEIDTEWSWGNYPYPWCTRDEVREVSAEAQRIHDDIAEGRLIIHCHADDGQNTVAVGTYATGVHRYVHLHGENHIRQVSSVYGTEVEAVAEFIRLYSAAIRPGPAPLTELEQTVRRVLAGQSNSSAVERLAVPSVEPPLAGPGEHEALLKALFDEGHQWDKYRPHDEITVASHESLTVRVEFDHEARHRTDVAWTIAEYNGPVGERLWQATITAGTPVALIQTMLHHLDTPLHAPCGELHEILRAAGWQSARSTWKSAGHAITVEHTPHARDDHWVLHEGNTYERAGWTIRLSAGVGDDLLAELASTATTLVPTPTPAPTSRAMPLSRMPIAVPQHRALHR
ncbi:DUF317 domain-containing protein [Streptomyces sp. NPDC051366]|uniref:DUF317 domain-containing protein n=1 Tax=Streptomyces sp. NPDC051366 TaxID=3365652 RepID=UPI000AB79403